VEEFRNRINIGLGKLAKLEPIYKRKDLSSHLKIRVTQALVFPAVTYGCESWNLNYAQAQRLRSFETQSYRRALRISYEEHKTNVEVFDKAGCTAMLERQVQRRKLPYFGHNVRQHESTEKSVILGILPGQRKRGGQRRLWINDITEWLSKLTGKPVSISEAVATAQDRQGYKCIIMGTNPGFSGTALSRCLKMFTVVLELVVFFMLENVLLLY
jgi:hypothetical protein